MDEIVGPVKLLSPGLVALGATARRDLERLNYPTPNWVLPLDGPDGRRALDVLIVGAGMCGQTVAFALNREGIRNFRIVDRAPRGKAGPWGTYARMDTLRSPKHLTGPDLGVPSLTFRAWYEAQNGDDAWRSLHKAGRLDWLDYLNWVAGVVGLEIEYDTEVTAIAPAGGLLRADISGPRGCESVYARKVVLACGRDGAGAPRFPRFPSLPPHAQNFGRVFHSADDIDFARFSGGRIAVLGAGASGFDNAAVALETGAAEVAMFVRRPHLPQVNKSKWTAFPGFLRGFAGLEDAARWDFYTYIFSEQVPPPHESVLRCERHAGFSIRLGEGWTDVAPDEGGVRIETAKSSYRFDAAIIATGFDVDIARRPELAAFHGSILLWADRVSPQEAAAHPDAARFPYLDDGMAFIEKSPGSCTRLSDLHVFNWGITMSHGALAGDIPGLSVGVNRLTEALVRDLFVADAARFREQLLVHEDAELKPTRWYVPPEERR